VAPAPPLALAAYAVAFTPEAREHVVIEVELALADG